MASRKHKEWLVCEECSERFEDYVYRRGMHRVFCPSCRNKHKSEYMRYYHQMSNDRCYVDAEWYAKIRKWKRRQKMLRSKARVEKLIQAGMRKKAYIYVQKPQTRLPDWSKKGQDVVDKGSRFIYENLSAEEQASCTGYGIELQRERKKAMTVEWRR